MTTTIRAAGDVIKIGKAFVSGKDRISVNDHLAFEGKLKSGQTEKFAVGSRHYSIEQFVTNKILQTPAIAIEISERGTIIHKNVYDHFGKSVASRAEAQALGVINACAAIGAIAGMSVAISLGMSIDGLPGGAVGGALKGGVGGAAGAMIGYGLGWSLSRLQKKSPPKT